MKKINFLYEFITPMGFLPIGYEIIDLPIIFSEINDIFDNNFHQIVRLTKEPVFRIVKGTSDVYDATFKEIPKNFSINRMLTSELRMDQLINDSNLFVIEDVQDSNVIKYVSVLDLNCIFTKPTSLLFNKNNSVKLVIVSKLEYQRDDIERFFNNIYKFVNTHKFSNDKIIFVTRSIDVINAYIKYLEKYKVPQFMKICKSIIEI